MYLTVKQQVKHSSKDDYHSIRELSHAAKNLTNEAIYNVRQYYFTEGKFLKYEKNYALLKNSLLGSGEMGHSESGKKGHFLVG